MSRPFALESSLLGTCPSWLPQKSAKVNAEAAVGALYMVRNKLGANLEVVEYSQQNSAQWSQRMCVLTGDGVQELLKCVRAPPLLSAERYSENSRAIVFCHFFYYVFIIRHLAGRSSPSSCSFGKVSWSCIPRVLVATPGFIREQQQVFSIEFLVTLSLPKAILTAAFFHFDVVPLCQVVPVHLAFSPLSAKQALVPPCRSTPFHVSPMGSPCLFLLIWVSGGNFRFSCRGFWLLPWVAPIIIRTTFEF